jgi:hypothetical protein
MCFEAGIVIVFRCKDPIVLHEASLEIRTYLTWMSNEQCGKRQELLKEYYPNIYQWDLHFNIT